MTATLKRTKRSQEWKTIEIADGVSIKLRIEPPNYGLFMLARGEMDAATSILHRFECVVGWDDVMTDPADGPVQPVPFTPENFQELLRFFPMAFNNVLSVLNTYFLRSGEDAVKNSDTQSLDGTAPTPPSTSMTTSETSGDSAKPSVTE